MMICETEKRVVDKQYQAALLLSTSRLAFDMLDADALVPC